MSVSAIIHQHEVSVIDIEAGEKALTLLVQSIVRRETTLEKTEDDIPENSCYKITISITETTRGLWVDEKLIIKW